MYYFLCQVVGYSEINILLRRIKFSTKPSLHMSRNVPILPNHNLPTHTNHFLTSSLKIGSLPIFSFCSKHQFHHLLLEARLI